MKKLMLFLWIGLPIILNGQPFGLDKETGLLTYDEVIRIDSMSDAEIYNKVKEWTVLNFKSSEDVIVGDIQPSLVKAIYIQAYYNGLISDFYNTLTVKIKDGALRITITDIHQTSGYKIEPTLFDKDWNRKPGKTRQRIYADIETKCTALVNSLKQSFIIVEDW